MSEVALPVAIFAAICEAEIKTLLTFSQRVTGGDVMGFSKRKSCSDTAWQPSSTWQLNLDDIQMLHAKS